MDDTASQVICRPSAPGLGAAGRGCPPDLRRPFAVAPAISVIVPVYRDWDRLPALIAALAAQDRRDFELVLVDNEPGAGNPVPSLPDPGVPVRRVPCARPGAYAARNAGAARARGALLVFTDADCLPAADWLRRMARAAAEHPGRILAGPVDMLARPDPGAWEIFDTVRGIPQHVFLRHGYAATANLALAAALFARLGGFDPARLSGGDAEFCRRARGRGVTLHLVPGARIAHPARRCQADLARKARRIKGGQVASGPWPGRIAWILRSLAPPLREALAYLVSPYPAAWRLTACRIRLLLWGTELAELGRLLILRQPPERR